MPDPTPAHSRTLAEVAFDKGRGYPMGSELQTNAYLAAIYHRLTAMDLAAEEYVGAGAAPVVPSTPTPAKKAAPARKRAARKTTTSKETSA